MKRLLSLVAVAIVLYSCQKEMAPAATDSNNENSGNLYELKIDLGNFGIETTDLSTQGNNVSNAVVAANKYLKYIFYGVYDSMGKLVSQVEQHKGDSNFGLISDKLKKGNYTICLAGSSVDTSNKWNMFYNTIDKLSTLAIFQSYDDRSDYFYKKLNIKIVDSDTTLNQIQLIRISGSLEIHFTDSIPSNILYVKANVSGMPKSFDFSTETVNNSYLTQSDIYFESGFQSEQRFCLGSNNKLKVEILAYDTNWTLAMDRVINNVYIYPNKRTILTGKFNDTLKVNTPIVVDPDYTGTININF